jgi:hypothetical protein
MEKKKNKLSWILSIGMYFSMLAFFASFFFHYKYTVFCMLSVGVFTTFKILLKAKQNKQNLN